MIKNPHLKQKNNKKEKIKKVEMKSNISNLPIVIAKYNGAWQFALTKIKLNRQFNLHAIFQSIRDYNEDVLLVLQKGPEKKAGEITYQDIYPTGTLCKIHANTIQNLQNLSENKKQLPENKNKIVELELTAISRVNVSDLIKANGYYLANYKELHDVYLDKVEEKKLFGQLLIVVRNHFQKNIQISGEILDPAVEINHAAVNSFIYALAYLFSKNPKTLQSILEENKINERLKLMLHLLENEVKLINLDRKLENKMRENVSGAQKDFYLREKIKVIKEELGDINSRMTDSEKIFDILKNRKFPKNIEERIREELHKFELTPQASAESSVIKNYIDWLIALPWYESCQENKDLKSTINTLNKTHYALEKPKQRIIEHLAVQIKTNNSKMGTIICFVGPPGVGKTSLAKSIALATGRKFVKISLGGVKDESEIRGHRRTYIGSMPGRIIQTMKKAKIINPLFLLDEIDKMSSDYRGDPASAMLEVLDPEQNTYFSDHYLEEPYNLSKVMFITTANDISNIPTALRDRLEIIHLHSYTELEKLQIAKKYLIKKIIKNNGLKSKNLQINTNILLKIIRNYTMEAGVRQLEREISTIARKIVVNILENNNDKKTFKINGEELIKYLGVEKYNFTKRNQKSEIGLVTGLAWTQYGGDILSIEATMYNGKGRLHLTGSLGDVMKESANIALGYIKTNYKKFQINLECFKKDIHIHVPEGAIPKDGPSAGVTITTVLVSLFKNIAISKNMAMTGEITLRGDVLPIGGLKEKLISATRSKIKLVFIPKDNIKNLIDIPKEILNSLIIYSVSDYMEIYEYLFANKKELNNESIKTLNHIEQMQIGS